MAILMLRKAWRLSAAIFPLIYYCSSKITALFVVLPFLCLFVTVECLRFLIRRFNEKLFFIFSSILKEKEKKTVLSATWLLLSIFLTTFFFKKSVAITAMLFLIFGDMSAGIIGTYFGRIKIGKHTLEGSLAFFLSCLIIAIFLRFTPLGLSLPVMISGAFAATLIELLPWLDDNFTVGLFSGIIMEIAAKFVS